MSVVVEHGKARCPRCMVLADYVFVEEPDGQLRYQVSCQPCGHVHSELCPAAAPAA